MTPRRTILIAVTLLLMTALPASTAVYAYNGNNTATNLSLSLIGEVVNAGSQHYSMRGGTLMGANIQTSMLDPTTANLRYYMEANVEGLTSYGYFDLFLTGTLLNGTAVAIHARSEVSAANPILLPNACLGAKCTSEIPTAFGGLGTVAISNNLYGNLQTPQTTVRAADHDHTHQSSTMPVAIESPYDNPFGAPIVITLGDQITIVTSYNAAHIDWDQVQMGGVVTGTSGNTPLTGTFLMVVNSNENLVAGIEYDHGAVQLALTDGSTAFNLQGHMSGTSTIPTAGEVDCSPAGLPGTCYMTGLTSTGNIRLFGDNTRVVGTYATQWAIPALGFASTVTATSTTSTSSD